MNSMQGIRNLFTHRILVIKLVVKKLQNKKFFAILWFSVMLAGIFNLSRTLSSPMNNVIIESTGRMATITPINYRSEIRGMFVHYSSMNNPNWDLITQTCKEYGINTLVVNVLGISAACYYSDYLLNRHGDQLTPALAAAHSRGLELHVLMSVLCCLKEDQMEISSTAATGDSRPNACPTKQATRMLLKNIAEELLTKFPDLDGFMFDYMRYAEEAADVCYCDECKAKLEKWLGKTITNWPGDFAPGGSRYLEFLEWRTIPLSELVRDMRDWMRSIKPELKFSLAAWTYFQDCPIYWRKHLGQDTGYWIKEGYLDFVAPMMYTASLADIQTELETNFKYMTAGPDGIIPLVSFLDCARKNTPETLKTEIDLIREMGADGWILWRYGGPGDGQGSNAPDVRDYLSILHMPPTFTLGNIQVSSHETHATIAWNTNLPTTSKVEYNTSSLFNASFNFWSDDFHYWNIDHINGTMVEDNTPITNHNITLTGLLPRTKYYFRVQSEGSGGIATSKVLTFTTKS